MVRRYLELDYDEVSKWCEARGGNPIPRSLLPRTGFIIDGVAVGFLYFTDSCLGIIDCYVSNPESDSKTRSDALDAITIALIKTARFHGCKIIKCDTKLEAIKNRALSHGFRPVGAHESFSLEID